jgi:hypothetical protein
MPLIILFFVSFIVHLLFCFAVRACFNRRGATQAPNLLRLRANKSEE